MNSELYMNYYYISDNIIYFVKYNSRETYTRFTESVRVKISNFIEIHIP